MERERDIVQIYKGHEAQNASMDVHSAKVCYAIVHTQYNKAHNVLKGHID